MNRPVLLIYERYLSPNASINFSSSIRVRPTMTAMLSTLIRGTNELEDTKLKAISKAVPTE